MKAEVNSLTKALSQSRAIIVSGIAVIIGFSLIVVSEYYQWKTTHSVRYAVFNQFGFALSVSGLLAYFTEFLSKRAFFADIRQELSTVLRSHFGAAQTINDSGVRMVHRQMPSNEITEKLGSARERIDILITFTTQEVIWQEAIKRSLTLNPACKVRLILMNPDDAAAKMRSNEGGYESINMVPDRIRLNLNEFCSFFKKHGFQDKVELLLYNGSATFFGLRIDGVLFFTTLVRSMRASNTPWFEVTVGDRHFVDDSFVTHMNHLAEHGKKVIIAEYKATQA